MRSVSLKRSLSPELIAGLNLARASAAIYVVVYHVAQKYVSGPAAVPFRFGQEAVIVFFLLSGFVIFANERDRVSSEPIAYLLRRIRRVYPVMLISLATAAALSAVDDSYVGAYRLRDLVATVLSVQDIGSLKPGVIGDPAFNNNPLWSLSYEMCFYVMFIPIMTAWRRYPHLTRHGIGLASILSYCSYVAYPNHWSLMLAYLSIWWAGAELALALQNDAFRLSRLLPILSWLTALSCISLLAVLVDGSRGVGYYPLLMTRHFAFAAGCVVIALLPAFWTFGRLSLGVGNSLSFLASISYGLYALHYPLLLNWSFAESPGGFLCALMILIIAAYLADRRLDQLLPRPHRPKNRV